MRTHGHRWLRSAIGRLAALVLLPILACDGESERRDETAADAATAAEDAGTADTRPDGDRAGAGVDASADVVACTLDPPLESSSPACRACAEAFCCTAYNAALGTPEGQAYLQCWGGCLLNGSEACSDGCAEDHPEGFVLFTAFADCGQAHCMDCEG